MKGKEPAEDEHVRELASRSLKGLIHQLKEDIIRCEAHLSVREDSHRVLARRLTGPRGRGRVHCVMIPEVDDNGNLPPGIHRATLAEVEERFGKST